MAAPLNGSSVGSVENFKTFSRSADTPSLCSPSPQSEEDLQYSSGKSALCSRPATGHTLGREPTGCEVDAHCTDVTGSSVCQQTPFWPASTCDVAHRTTILHTLKKLTGADRSQESEYVSAWRYRNKISLSDAYKHCYMLLYVYSVDFIKMENLPIHPSIRICIMGKLEMPVDITVCLWSM